MGVVLYAGEIVSSSSSTSSPADKAPNLFKSPCSSPECGYIRKMRAWESSGTERFWDRREGQKIQASDGWRRVGVAVFKLALWTDKRCLRPEFVKLGLSSSRGVGKPEEACQVVKWIRKEHIVLNGLHPLCSVWLELGSICACSS